MSSASGLVRERPVPALPKRARGHLRVERILDAAAVVFTEKGFAATTMSEVAARADTAIGSLYRFFPTKGSLADALIDRYVDAVAETFDALARSATASTTSALADAMFDLMLDRRRDRAAILALTESHAGGENRPAQLRERILDALSAVLGAVAPWLDASVAAIRARVLLQLLKTIRPAADDPRDTDARLAELRVAVRLYLAHCVAPPGDRSADLAPSSAS